MSEDDYQKEEFIKLAIRRKRDEKQEAGSVLSIEADEKQRDYQVAVDEEQLKQQLQQRAQDKPHADDDDSSGTILAAEKNSSFLVGVEPEKSDTHPTTSREMQSGYGFYQMNQSVFHAKENERCSILGQVESEQHKKSSHQTGPFLKNGNTHFIKNTTKQIAATPGKVMRSYVKQAKIAQMITSGDVHALVRTSASFGLSGIARTLRMFGYGIIRVCKWMLHIVLKILAPVIPYVIIIVASMFLLFLLIMGCEVDTGTNNKTALYSYALSETQQLSGAESDTRGGGHSASSGIVNTHMSNYIYFNQGDYSDPMGCTSLGVTTIRSSGCGLTALASVLATWTDDTSITPRTVLNYGLNGRDGNTCSIVLVSSSLYGGMCEQYGLTYETIVPKDATKLRTALVAGKSVIVLLSNRAKWSDGSYVTSRTHYIVLMGFAKNGKIACMNPAGGTKKYIDFNTVVNDTGTDTFHVIYSEEKLQQWKQEDNK